MQNYLIAVGYMLMSALSLALAAAFGRHLTTLASLNIVVFVRFFGPFVIISMIFFLTSQKMQWEKSFLLSQFLRAIFLVIAQYCFFFVLSKSNLLNATVLFATNGLFSPFIARVFLKTKIKGKTLFAISISFIGILITFGYGGNLFSIITIIGLLSGFFNACSQVVLHHTSKTQNRVIVNFTMYGLTSFLALCVIPFTCGFKHAILSILSLSRETALLVIIFFSLFSVSNQLFRTSAYRRVNNIASLMPFLYTSIIFAGVIDWVWLRIIPGWHIILGVTVIISGNIIMLLNAVKNKRSTCPPNETV